MGHVSATERIYPQVLMARRFVRFADVLSFRELIMFTRHSWCCHFAAAVASSSSRSITSAASRRGLHTLAAMMLGWAVAAPVAHAAVQCTGEHKTNSDGTLQNNYQEALTQCEAIRQDEIDKFGGTSSDNDDTQYEKRDPNDELATDYLRINHCEDTEPTTAFGDWAQGRVGYTYQSGRRRDTQNESGQIVPGEVIWKAPRTKDNAWTCKPQPADAAKVLGKPEGSASVGDPIDTATGNVYRQETDVQVGQWLRFTRYYNSDKALSVNGVLGPRWTSTYSRRISYEASAGPFAPAVARVMYDNGKARTYFRYPGGNWGSGVDVSDDLTWKADANGQPTGWTLTRRDEGTIETYNAAGQLTKLVMPDGFALTLTYVAGHANQIDQIVDPQGRNLRFAYDAQGRLQSLTLPDGSVASYAYNASGELANVTRPGNDQRAYQYDEAAHTKASADHRLTGVLDGHGTRLATYDYQADGRATATTLAGGTQGYTLQYNSDGSTRSTDPFGTTVTRYFKEIAGARLVNRISAPCESCGTTAAWDYDAKGRPTALTDFNGQRTTLKYDDSQREIERLEAAGTSAQRRVLTTWDSTVSLPTMREVRDASDRPIARTFVRYGAGATARMPAVRCEVDPAKAPSYTCPIAEMSTPAGVRRWNYGYCVIPMPMLGCPLAGLLQTVAPPGGAMHQYIYSYYTSTDESGCATTGGACHRLGDLYQITHLVSQRALVTVVSYDKNGRAIRLKDPNGVISDLTYNARGQLLSRTVRANADGSSSANDATTQLAYDDAGNVNQTTDADGVVLRYTHDAARRLTDIQDAQGNRIHYTLDNVGNQVKEETFDANGGLRRILSRTYNVRGQLRAIVDGLNQTVFSAATADSYDPNGNLLRSTDALGTQRQLGYDALSRLVSIVDNANGTDSATANTQGVFNRDALDRIDGISDPDGLNTVLDYDGLGNVLAQRSPDSGTTQNVYDAAGNLTQSSDAKGVVRTYTYDYFNRVTSVSTGSPGDAVTYVYDETNNKTGCASSNPIGRLTRVVEQAITTTYCYDAQGRVTEKRQAQGEQADITRYSYTKAGRLSTITQPSGAQVNYARNNLGQVTAISVTPAKGAATTVASNISYLPFGPIASYTLGNGQAITRTYDANYRLTDLTSIALTLHYTRDAMGNVSTLSTQGVTDTYHYDALGRVIAVKDASGKVTEAYTYNKTGDRLNKTSSGLATGNYGYQIGTHWLTSIGSAARSVDANGNTTGNATAGETWGYGYDGHNRMTVLQREGATVAT